MKRAFLKNSASGEVAAAMTGFTPLPAFSMLVFILLYVPCVAAVSTLFSHAQGEVEGLEHPEDCGHEEDQRAGFYQKALYLLPHVGEHIAQGGLRRFGLSGKAFIPMLMGFGCSVPAIMGARTMAEGDYKHHQHGKQEQGDGKNPVGDNLVNLFAEGERAGLVVFGLYVIGMVVGVLSGLFFKKALFTGEPAPFVLELPPYRLPKAARDM